MTVSSETSRKTFTGDAVTTSFATSPMTFFETSNLVVYVVTTATGASTTLTEGTHYTVSGGDGSTGTVNLAGGTSPYGAPSAAQTLVIVRDLPYTQATDFANNDNSDADVVEEAFDRLTMQAQQLATSLGRAILQPDSDPTTISALPSSVDRASKYMAFDADGDPVATAGTTSDVVVSTFMETLLDDTTAAAARATLDAQQDVFTTRGDLVRAGASGVAERVALGASGTVLKSDGTDAAWSADAATESDSGRVELATQTEVNAMADTGRVLTPNHNKIVLGTEQATTSGTAKDFTSIPSGVRRITVFFDAAGLSGSDDLLVQIGTGGSPTTSGYVSGSNSVDASGGTDGVTSTAGFILALNSDTLVGKMTIELADSANNTWIASHIGKRVSGSVSLCGAGDVDLAGVLDLVRVTRTGTDAFDAGAVNISYER